MRVTLSGPAQPCEQNILCKPQSQQAHEIQGPREQSQAFLSAKALPAPLTLNLGPWAGSELPRTLGLAQSGPAVEACVQDVRKKCVLYTTPWTMKKHGSCPNTAECQDVDIVLPTLPHFLSTEIQAQRDQGIQVDADKTPTTMWVSCLPG